MSCPGFSRELALAFVLATGAGACGGGEEENGSATPVFPADYLDRYMEVRDCRQSADHSLVNVRMLADAAALGPYESRAEPFPVGAVVLKEEYAIGDADCQGDIEAWTVMQKLEEGSSPDTLDWAWQRVDMERNVTSQNDGRCTSCHRSCGVPPDGYAGTCAIP